MQQHSCYNTTTSQLVEVRYKYSTCTCNYYLSSHKFKSRSILRQVQVVTLFYFYCFILQACTVGFKEITLHFAYMYCSRPTGDPTQVTLKQQQQHDTYKYSSALLGAWAIRTVALSCAFLLRQFSNKKIYRTCTSNDCYLYRMVLQVLEPPSSNGNGSIE